MDLQNLFGDRVVISTAEVAEALDIDPGVARDYALENGLNRLGASFVWEPHDVQSFADELADEGDGEDDEPGLAANPYDPDSDDDEDENDADDSDDEAGCEC